MELREFKTLVKSTTNIVGYIYKITNIETGKIYIGQSTKLKDHDIDNYFGSGVIIRKISKTLLKKEILGYAFTFHDLNTLEEQFIYEMNSTDRSVGYNVSKTVNYLNKENIIGQKNPASASNMTAEDRHAKALKAAKTRRETIDDNGASVQDIITLKMNNSKKIIGEDGLSVHERSASKAHATQKKRGTDKTRIDNMVKTKKEKGSFSAAAAKAARTIKEKGLLKGSNNPKAKSWVLISPDGEVFEICGTLKDFAKEHNLQVRLLRNFLNKGKICLESKNFSSQKSFNTQGWEIKNA